MANSEGNSFSKRAEINRKHRLDLALKSFKCYWNLRYFTTKITVLQKDGELKYISFYKQPKGKKEMVSINQAIQRVLSPVLMHLDVRNGKEVTDDTCQSFGLCYDGEREFSKGWGRKEEDWVPTNIGKHQEGTYWARDYRNDAKNEWHNDVLLWSLSGLSENSWLEAV